MAAYTCNICGVGFDGRGCNCDSLPDDPAPCSVIVPDSNPFADAPLLDPKANPFTHYMRKGPGFATAAHEEDFLTRR